MKAGVLGFVEQVLQQQGALVEPAGPDQLEVMLSERLQRDLELPEYVQLSPDRDESLDPPPIPRLACGYGSPLLGRLAGLALGEGKVAAGRALLAQPAIRQPGGYSGLNVSMQLLDVSPEPQWVLAALGRTLVSFDDRREGVAWAAVELPSGVELPMPELADLEVLPLVPGELAELKLEQVFPRLLGELRGQALNSLEELRLTVARRHRRDAERVERYFAEMEQDLHQRIARRPGGAAGLQSKLEAIPAELQRRRAQLAANHTLKLNLDLIGLVILQAPGLLARLEVKRRKNKRVVEARYHGLLRHWAGLRCDGCGSGTFAFALCDEARHLLCPDCWGACGSGGHRPCFRCAGKPERRPEGFSEVAGPGPEQVRGAAAPPRLAEHAPAKPAPARPAVPTQPTEPAPPRPAEPAPTKPAVAARPADPAPARPVARHVAPAKPAVAARPADPAPARPSPLSPAPSLAKPAKTASPAREAATPTPMAPPPRSTPPAPRQLDLIEAIASCPEPEPHAARAPAPDVQQEDGEPEHSGASLSARDLALQQQILDLLRSSAAPLSSTKIREQVDTDVHGLRRLLTPLLVAGLVGREGQTRATRYFWTGKPSR